MPLPKERSKIDLDYLNKIYLIYGVPKSGKTNLVSKITEGDSDDNKVIFFPTEPGHKFQSIYKWQKFNEATGKYEDPVCWEDFLTCARELLIEEHDFKAIAIDIADNLFRWCSEYVCKKNDIDHESDMAYGKGYSLIRQEFIKPIEFLAQKGFGIFFISHEGMTEKQVGPRKVSYTDTTLPNTAKKIIHGISDYIFYIHTDLEKNRWIQTKSSENVNAGDRMGTLPPLISYDLEAKELLKHLKQD